MKKKLILLTLCTLLLNAENIVLTSQQEENWQIKTEIPQKSETLPLGEFIVKVVTPPELLHTISLPFDANVKKLYVANYQGVTKGEVLADVTGTEWIETQQKAISDVIELKQYETLTKRKNLLCKEEIIPKKECIAANAELEVYRVKVAASKALVQSYGASDEMIRNLYEDLKLSPTIPIRSTVDGRIIQLNAMPGKSTNSSDAFFIIQQKGPLWLEGAIEVQMTKMLQEGDKVQIEFDGHAFNSTILQLSPVVNPENQTRNIRFLVPGDVKIFSGARSSAKIILEHKSIKIKKSAVIKIGDEQIVFTQNKEGYRALPIEILSEDDSYYFVKPSTEFKSKIAVTSVAILKNMLGNDDE